MKVRKSIRRNLVVGTTLVALTATTGFAQFGFPSIVFDPSSYGELITQATTAYTQLQTIKNNLTHFSFKTLWRTQEQQMKQANVRSLFGETDGMTTALNTNSATASSMAWTNATVPMASSTTTYLAGQTPGSSQLSQLAMIEASDSVSPDCLNAIGAYRAARTNDAAAVASLQQQQLDGSDGSNTEIEQLNLLNASQAQHMIEVQNQGVLHACLASQMAIANMQQRNAAAQDLNTWSFVKQQQQVNPTYVGGGSDTNSFIP